MLHRRYMVYGTNNNVAPTSVDDDKLETLKKIAGRIAQNVGLPTEPGSLYVEHLTLRLKVAYLKSIQELGICAAMVCTWALDYLSSGDLNMPNYSEAEAQNKQGKYMMTIVKRGMLDKPDPEGIAMSKMAASMDMSLKEVASGTFPSDSRNIRVEETPLILGKVALEDRVPFLLGVVMKRGSSRRHAIGLLHRGENYYILDPNWGLFVFKDRNEAEREIGSHFIGEVATSSNWMLRAIGKLEHEKH